MKALINPNVLRWAREEVGYSHEEISHKMKISIGKLVSWENGELLPTINQAKNLANRYKVPFIVFYLPACPDRKFPKFTDFRRLKGIANFEISKELTKEIANAISKREILLQLRSKSGKGTREFLCRFTKDYGFKEVARKIISYVGLDREIQQGIKDNREFLNYCRELLEEAGILVLQTKSVPLVEMRGIAVNFDEYPIIILNRKDSYAGRLFTLFHELTHIVLSSNSICDLEDSLNDIGVDDIVERFCNRVSAEVLVPEKMIMQTIEVKNHRGMIWDEKTIVRLARKFSVSREVIIGRFLNLKMTNYAFYQMKLKEYDIEYKDIEAKKSKVKRNIIITPDVNTISLNGNMYVAEVVNGYGERNITSSDVTEYLNAKMKHFPKIERKVTINAKKFK